MHHFQNLKLYNIYKDYIEISPNCGESQAFYRRPLENGLDISQQPIGLDKLSSIMKAMFLEADIAGYYIFIIQESAHLRQHSIKQASPNKKIWKGRAINRWKV